MHRKMRTFDKPRSRIRVVNRVGVVSALEEKLDSIIVGEDESGCICGVSVVGLWAGTSGETETDTVCLGSNHPDLSTRQR